MMKNAILKTVKSHLCNDSTDLDEIWHGNAYQPSEMDWLLKFWISEIQDGSNSHLQITKIAIPHQWFDQASQNLARWSKLGL